MRRFGARDTGHSAARRGGPTHEEQYTLDALPLSYRAIVSLWRQSHAAVCGPPRGAPPSCPAASAAHTAANVLTSAPSDHMPVIPSVLSGAAVHAVLAGLRRHATTAALFADHEADPTRDFQLIASLLPYEPDGSARHVERLQQVREAAFWLRWLELTGQRPPR